MTQNDFERGQASAQNTILREQMSEMWGEVHALRAEVHEIKLTLARIEGGWKVAVAVAAVVGTVVGYMMRFLVR